jgi:hypothetical protein
MYATPADNYWIVADQPAAVRWSSAGAAYVADTDATYLAWIAAGFEVSYIASEQELADLLNETYPAGSPIPAPPASTSFLGPMTVETIFGNAGNYTVPADVYKLIVFGQAAGGGGGGTGTAAANIGGGGGAGETRCMILNVQPGQVLPWAIGAKGVGGVGATSGSAAGDLTLGGTPSPSPSVAGTSTFFDGITYTTQAYTLPAGIVAGDLILIMLRSQLNSSHTITTPAGYTLLADTLSGLHHCASYYKIAAGGETSVTFVTSAASYRVFMAYRITGHDPATAPLVAGASGTSVTANPPSLSVAAWGSVNKLAIAWAGSGHDVTGVPAGYTNPIGGPNPGAFWAKAAQRSSNETSYDPGPFTAQNELWAAQTIAIKCVPPSTIMTCKGGTGGNPNSGTSGTTPSTGSGGVQIFPTLAASALLQTQTGYSIGGASLFGLGSLRITGTAASGADANIGTSSGYGGGGCGGMNVATSGTARNGGDGAPGMFLIFGFGK